MPTASQTGDNTSKAEAREKKYNGFSCPQEGLDLEFSRQIAVKFARKCLRRFLDRFGGILENSAEGLAGFLENWLGQDCSFEEAWSPFIGAIHEALLSPVEVVSDDILERAAGLGLHLTAAGYEGDWNLQLDSASTFRFDRFLLPPTGRLKVTARQNRVRLELGESSIAAPVIEAEKSAEGWDCLAGPAVVLPQLMIGGRAVIILPAEVFASQEGALFENVTPAGEALAITLGKYEQALALIARSCPEYLEWIGRAIRGIVPVNPLAEARCSGSDTLRPGLIYISTDESPFYLAEGMIHESTHQYMFMLTRLGPLENGADTTLYYSPVRRMNRPIGAIALAYHAFGNILLFFKGCVDNNLGEDDFIVEHMPRITGQMAELEKALRTSPGLSAQGRAIWEPLAARL